MSTIETTVGMLNSGQPRERTERLVLEVMNLARESDAKCVELVKAGVISKLFSILDPQICATESIILPIMVIISNIAAVEENHDEMVREGAILQLIWVLSNSPSDAAKGSAAVALGNLATNFVYSRQIGDEPRGIPSLVEYLRNSATDVGKGKAAGTLWNLCDKNNVQNKQKIVHAGGIEPLVDLLTNGTPISQEYACGALAKLASESAVGKLIVKAGAIPPLVSILTNGTQLGKQHSTLALRNLSTNQNHKVFIRREMANPNPNPRLHPNLRTLTLTLTPNLSIKTARYL